MATLTEPKLIAGNANDGYFSTKPPRVRGPKICHTILNLREHTRWNSEVFQKDVAPYVARNVE